MVFVIVVAAITVRVVAMEDQVDVFQVYMEVCIVVTLNMARLLLHQSKIVTNFA